MLAAQWLELAAQCSTWQRKLKIELPGTFMPKLLASSETVGSRATIELDSKKVCIAGRINPCVKVALGGHWFRSKVFGANYSNERPEQHQARA
jgi:hypothetical protein